MSAFSATELRVRDPFAARRRTFGFTLIELLLVLGVVGVIAGISLSLSAGLRARLLLQEQVARVEGHVSMARAEAKRVSTTVSVTAPTTGDLLLGDHGDLALAGGVRFDNSGVPGFQPQLSYDGAYGLQTPYGPVTWELVATVLGRERRATFTVLPPLGITVVRYEE